MTNPENPDKNGRPGAGWQRAVARNWTTRVQVSGWRFMVRRVVTYGERPVQ